MAQAVVGGGGSYFYYTVKSGDTLSEIGARYGVNYRTIMTLNGLRSTVIRAGQKLKIPSTKPSNTVPAPTPSNSGGQAKPMTGNAADFSPMLDKMIGGVLLYGIFRVLMKVF